MRSTWSLICSDATREWRATLRSDQASRCLADPMLGSRLRHGVGLMMRHKSKSALEILGSPDDLKFRSCLTLFAQAALINSQRGVQRRTGAVISNQARFRREQRRYAATWMRTAESSNALTFHFCPTCGSPPRRDRTTLAAGK
jgi:Protein of unknown function (DUF1810)